MQPIQEASRLTPVVGQYDVIVCGGGTSGFPAAIAAARAGARVALIERYGFLGGVPAYCIMPAWHSINRYHSRMLGEFMKRAKEIGPGPTTAIHFDPEYVKIAALDMVTEAGVEVHLHSLICDVVMEEGRIRGVITESKSGRRAFLADSVIDCTGDGDVCVMAGADSAMGDEEAVTQGMTIRFRIGGIDFDPYFDWIRENKRFYNNLSDEMIDRYRQAARIGRDWYMGADLSELYRAHNADGRMPVLSYFNCTSLRAGELSCNATRVYGRLGTVEEDLTYAEITCRQQMNALWQFLRAQVPGFADSVLLESATQIGVRETRRIVGDHILNEKECRERVSFPDTICYNPIAFDLHGAKYTCEILSHNACIPFRILLPKGVEGLMMAGRCVSTDHVANASVRRMHTAFDLGQICGIASALAAKAGTTPRAYPFEALRRVLVETGAFVPDFREEEIAHA